MRLSRTTLVTLLGLATALLGALVLLGWLVEARPLLTVLPGLVSMQPATALDFVLLGSVCVLLARVPDDRPPGRPGRAALVVCLGCLGAVTLVAGTALVQELAGQPYLFETLGDMGQNDGRMSGITAVSHLLLAAALGARLAGARRGAHAAGVAALAVGVFGVSGYMFGVSDLYDVGYVQTLALHTAVGIVLVGIAAVLLVGDIGLLALAASGTDGGRLVRTLLPVIVLVPLAGGWVAVRLMRSGMGPGFGLAVYATVVAVLSGGLVWYAGARLRASDIRRQEALAARAEAARALAELKVTTRELDRANQDLRDFTSAAAHDLKGPLAAVLMGVEMLRRPGAEDTRDEVVERVGGAAGRGMRLIDDLLAFAEVGTVDTRTEPLDLRELTHAVVAAVQESSGRRVHLSEAGWSPVLADRNLVRQALLNLVGNAVKYTPGPGPVEVEVGCEEDAGGMVLVWVADRGIDVPEDERPLIFEVFRRGVAGARAAEGTGVGLAIVRRVAERHGGRAGVGERPGWAKRFEITLPAVPAPAQRGDGGRRARRTGPPRR